MRRILAFSLAQPVPVLAITALFAVAGAVAFFPSPAAEEVERQVTLPIERATLLVLPVLYTLLLPERAPVALLRTRRQGLGDRLATLFLWRSFACAACRRRFRCFVAPFGLADEGR